MSSGPTSTRDDSPGSASSPAGLIIGRILALIGLVVFIPASLYLISIALDSLGMILGVVAYFLGARRLGTVTIVLGLAALIFGLLTQGYPGGPGSPEIISDGTAALFPVYGTMVLRVGRVCPTARSFPIQRQAGSKFPRERNTSR